MEDIKDLMDRLKKRIISGGAADKPELKRRLDVIYEIYAGAVGPEELIVRASRYGALKYIHHENLKKRLLGIERLFFESREYTEEPQEGEIPAILDRLEDRLAELLARRAVEERLERKISERLEEKHKEYVDEVKRELLEEDEDDVETAQSRHKMEKLEALDKISLTKTVMNVVKPGTLSEIVGQNDAVKALASKIASPYPQHLILYGPPGVGKTTAARLVLEEAKKTAWSAFGENAPFVECDGTTLRWDSRDITNPLIGSVHDPIYQGAQRELADDGIPEPKPGLVTDAHGGILFIDEIGELDPILLNKLLKVLEDKRVPFESAYYDEENPYVPAYIKKLFRDGAPADFILIGATTREPQEINPAIRSRCAEVFFEPLRPEDVETIVKNAAEKLKVSLEDGVAEMISEYTMEGRKAVNLLADAYSLAVYEAGGAGKGTLHFNNTAGSMAKDSVATAASVVRRLTDKNLGDYDLHVNVIGGGNVDGPSAGCAVTAAIISAVEQKPLRQDWAVTGEISLSGEIKPVGGVYEKAFGAHQAGMKGLIIPAENKEDIGETHFGMEVAAVRTIEDVLDKILVK